MMKTFRMMMPKSFNDGDEFASWIDQQYRKIGGSDFVEIPRKCSADLIRYVKEKDQAKLRKIPIVSYVGGFGAIDEVGKEEVLELNAWIAKPSFLSTEYIFIDSRLLVGLSVFVCAHSYGSLRTNMMNIAISVLHSIFGYQEDPWEEQGKKLAHNILNKPQYAELIIDVFRFIIAHEYGHFLLDHLRTAKLKSIHRLSDQTVAAFQTSQHHEIEADCYAYDLTIKSTDLRNYSGVRRAAELLFWCFHLGRQVIQGYREAANLETGYSTHPEPLQRIHNLRLHAQASKSQCLKRFGYDARLKEVDNSNENFLKLIENGYTSPFITNFFRCLGQSYYNQPKNLIDYINKSIDLLNN